VNRGPMTLHQRKQFLERGKERASRTGAGWVARCIAVKAVNIRPETNSGDLKAAGIPVNGRAAHRPGTLR